MNQRYLVTHVMSSDPSGPPIVKAFPVSAQVRAQDITYPVNTLVFFFVSTEMTLEELVSQFFTIREKKLEFHDDAEFGSRKVLCSRGKSTLSLEESKIPKW